MLIKGRRKLFDFYSEVFLPTMLTPLIVLSFTAVTGPQKILNFCDWTLAKYS